MYHNILVPLALHHEEQDARAIGIAKALASPQARITLLHVLEEIPGYAATYIPHETFEKNKRDATEALERIAKREGHEGPGHVVWGHAARTILDERVENQNDCIVMHSHRPALEDYFLGSTASHVVRHAACSVHVIR